MSMDTSTTRGRRRLLVLAVAVITVLGLVAWAVSASVGSSKQSAAGAADRESSATAEPAGDASTAAPPTEMPDGSPIPSPSPGTPAEIGEGETVAVEPVEIRPAVALDETGDFGTGLTVTLTGIEPVQGVARAPGEIAGPALEVRVQASNDSADPISLDGVVVFLSYGEDRTPATDFGDGRAPLRGDLAARSAATGTYVFAVPEDERDDVRVEISYTGEAPTVAFAGSVA